MAANLRDEGSINEATDSSFVVGDEKNAAVSEAPPLFRSDAITAEDEAPTVTFQKAAPLVVTLTGSTFTSVRNRRNNLFLISYIS